MSMLDSKAVVTLYHGSTQLFNEIDTGKGKPYKDFGKGFYTTLNIDHASRLALRNKAIEERRCKQLGLVKKIQAHIYTYELDMKRLAGLSVKEFADTDREWVLFVLGNRGSNDKTHTYDVVIGPTADDDTRTALRAYSIGVYGEADSDEALGMLIHRLKAFTLPGQIYFSNNKAASLLFPKGDVMLL